MQTKFCQSSRIVEELNANIQGDQKVSVYLTIVLQPSSAQRLFDHYVLHYISNIRNL